MPRTRQLASPELPTSLVLSTNACLQTVLKSYTMVLVRSNLIELLFNAP